GVVGTGAGKVGGGVVGRRGAPSRPARPARHRRVRRVLAGFRAGRLPDGEAASGRGGVYPPCAAEPGLTIARPPRRPISLTILGGQFTLDNTEQDASDCCLFSDGSPMAGFFTQLYDRLPIVRELRHITRGVFDTRYSQADLVHLERERLRLELLCSTRYSNPRHLARFEAQTFSQHGEDGITLE